MGARRGPVTDNDPPAPREAFETLLDSFAVQTEQRDITRLEAFRELLVALLNDDGRQFDWTHDPKAREWITAALRGIDEQLADS